MAKLSNEDLLEHFKEMTLLELSAFIKEFEDTFDVTAAAAAPVMMAAAAVTSERALELLDERRYQQGHLFEACRAGPLSFAISIYSFSSSEDAASS